MCEHCGCRGIEPIAELMDEHYALLDEAHAVRLAMGAGHRATALAHLERLVEHLDGHVRREEVGVFAALRAQDEFVEEVEQLEKEHRGFDEAIADLDPASPDLERRIADLLRELDEHVERENLGIFPVTGVTLGARGWEMVEEARRDHPTFLPPE
ncbi:MAG TPA: hemerythrin domain-containing protein [Nocardioides sp.]|nr:hemerythrin domain-containing protein [Nocardioides sp.]